MVAESDRCLCLEENGAAPVLYFPRASIDLGAFVPGGSRHEERVGTVRCMSIDAADGDDVLALVEGPPPPALALAGHGSFDTERVRVDVLDGAAGDDPRDVTVKRFPVWGDAADLVDLLDVRAEQPLRYVSTARSDGRRPVVEGSQMLAQAMVAASRHAPGRRVVTASMVFLRVADAAHPLAVQLSPLSEGRSFTALSAQVLQDSRTCAAGTLLLGAPAPDVIRHAVGAPEVSGPYDSTPFDMGVTGRDLRVVDGAYTNDPHAPPGPPALDAWVRFRHVPDDQALQAGLLAQFTGHMPIAAAFRPYEGIGQAQAHATLSTAINGITVSIHDDIRADHWMLYHHLSTFAGGGMTHAECRVHTEEGSLLASFTVDAMVRPFAPGPARDPRTAL